MRVGVYLADIRRSMTDSHGIVNHAIGLACAIPPHLSTGDRLMLFYGREMREELDSVRRLPVVEALEVTTPASISQRLRSDHLSAWRWMRAAGLDVIHFPKGFIPVVPAGTTKVVATIHDDIAVQYHAGSFGRSSRSLKSQYFARATRHALRHADHVITVSAFSQAALIRHCPAVDNRITVLGNGVSLPLLNPVPRNEKRPVFVHFGSPLPHKRSLQAVLWTRRFLDADERFSLIVTGPLSPEAEEAARHPRIIRRPDLMTNHEVATLLRDAMAVIFPSVLEGFGLPPVEAACLGTPSVWARAAALPEVMGEAPGSFLPDDESSFHSALLEVVALDDGCLTRLAQHFRRRHSWHGVARGAMAVYRHLSESAQVPTPGRRWRRGSGSN